MAASAALCFVIALSAAFVGTFIADTGAISTGKTKPELALWALASANAGLLAGLAILHHRLQQLNTLTQPRLTLLTLAGALIILAGGALGHLAARI